MSHKVNIHIYPSFFVNESRLLNITESLSTQGIFSKIYIFALQRQDLPKRDALDNVREIIRLAASFLKSNNSTFVKSVRNVEWSTRIVLFLFGKRVDCINCHSLPMLPVCVFLKFLKGSKLVYDTHELETETVNLFGARKKIFKMIERFLIRFADVVVVVSDSISDWYKKQYNVTAVYTVRNLPRQVPVDDHFSNVFKETFGIKDDEILFIYQGGLFKGRGVEILLSAFSKCTSGRHIVFMGFGPLENTVKKYQEIFLNIHFYPAVNPRDISRYTRCADVGICLIENTCLSYYYSLPNKLFEYLSCGLPVVASDFPEMSKTIKDNACGWTIDVAEDAVIHLIEKISKDDILKIKKHVLDIKGAFDWQKEEEEILKIYRIMDF